MKEIKRTVIKVEPQTSVRINQTELWILKVEESYLQELDQRKLSETGKVGRTLFRRRQLEKYFAYKDELQYLVRQQGFVMPNGCFLIHFYIPMHRTWRKKKLIEMNGRPHQSKPDADNLLKAAFDAIIPKKKRSKGERGKDDKELWSYTVMKTWCNSSEARIEIIEYDASEYMAVFNKKAPL